MRLVSAFFVTLLAGAGCYASGGVQARVVVPEPPPPPVVGVSVGVGDRFTQPRQDLLDAQPEFTKAPWGYLDLLVNDDRIARGRQLLTQYAQPFDAVERAYGVDKYIIAAIWGVESNYSTLGGTRPVVRSTATLTLMS